MRRRTMLGTGAAAMALGGIGRARAATTLRVMSYNTYFAGGMLEPPAPFERTIEAIRAAGADIVGLQEMRAENPEDDGATAIGPSVAPRIAAALGWHLLEQDGHPEALWANAIVSRLPIRGATPAGLGAAIEVEGRTVHLYNIHLPDAPYQPYQLKGIPYGDHPFITTEAEAIRFAQAARGAGIRLLLEDLKAAADSAAVFVTGDFNEPSHRDWTARAAAIGRHPIAVRWPTTLALEEIGFVDAYRAIHPDEIAKPGFTWTPTTRPDDPEDHHDRIDFVLARGPGLEVVDAAIVGEHAEVAEIVVSPWPSDHRAVVAGFRFWALR